MSIKVTSDFVTKEITLVAFLDINGIKPTEYIVTQKGTKKIASFKFIKNDKLMELKEMFFNGEGKIEPLTYMDIIRRIKTKINNMDV